jgi:chromosomal replication initiator protein
MNALAAFAGREESPVCSAIIGSSLLLAAMVDASNRVGIPLCDLLGSRPRPFICHIQRATARHFKLPQSDMVSSRRSRDAAWARQVAMYLARKLTLKSLPDIGRRFGHRDHTTVIHAVRAVEARIPWHEETATAIREITAALTGEG